ncbi:MAG: cobalt transporter, partial [Rhodospirillales bacterium]|nr:cobalt transporter [Rhodospirillales bacterium]
LSAAYQGGVVAWVAFWAIYGQGAGAANLAQIASFGAAYMAVVLIEPVVDLMVLGAVKSLDRMRDSRVFQRRLHHVPALVRH